MKLVHFLSLLTISFFSFSQATHENTNYLNEKPPFIASTISTHPLGLLLSRVNHNFQTKPVSNLTISFQISGGNVWLPYVKAYKPLHNEDREKLKKNLWENRIHAFDHKNKPAETIEFYADALIVNYELKLDIPINESHELKLKTRAFSLERGENSLLTSDQFIEWFHSNIAGGEDPFARKIYGFNNVGMRYVDENGKVIEFTNDSFVFAGIDLSYYYYPQFTSFQKRNIHLNIGAQLGINTTKYNPYLDLGINPTILKKMVSKNKKREIIGGISIGVLRQRINKYSSSSAVKISNRKQIYSSELYLNYRKQIKSNYSLSVATTYFIQGAFNKRKEFDYLALTGDRISSHWNYAISHLYRPTTGNNLILTFSAYKTGLSVYFREDFLVDNAPDTQSGIAINHSF